MKWATKRVDERLYPSAMGIIACVHVKAGGKPSLEVIHELGMCGEETDYKTGEKVWNGFTHYLCKPKAHP